MKRVLKVIGIILGIIILIPILFIVFLRIVMYDPKGTEAVGFTSGSTDIAAGSDLSVLTFNVGYAGYNKDEDFFMDGGQGVLPESSDAVMTNLSGIASIINSEDCDIVFCQETDLDSRRSFHINEVAYLSSSTGMANAFACNYKVVFIPYPVPPIGSVNSGITTYTNLKVANAERYALPDTAPWYMSMGYLKRCLLVERVPVAGTDKDLVLINLHLEAYTDEEKRDMQMSVLADVLSDEYARGNYVIAGGDFNQAFADLDHPPLRSTTGWLPGEIRSTDIPEGFSLAIADNAPSCRSLEEAFVDNETSQVYIIDGFIVSDNIDVKSVEVKDYGFESSDHNPVRMEVRLKQ